MKDSNKIQKNQLKKEKTIKNETKNLIMKLDRFQEYIKSLNSDKEEKKDISYNDLNKAKSESSEVFTLTLNNPLVLSDDEDEPMKLVLDNNIVLNETFSEDSTSSEVLEEKKCFGIFKYGYEEKETNFKTSNILQKVKEIEDLLEKNDIVLVTGDTGCGKTTMIPKLLMKKYKNIVCTQPRKLAAINVARKVASDLKCKVGDKVGYSVRFDSKISKNTTLRFVTDGVLLLKFCSNSVTNSKNENTFFKKNKKEKDFDLIIIDEAHERSINIDFLLGYFKRLQKENKLFFKVIIMSATLNVEKFIEFFNCPIVTINQKKHKIEYFYLKTSVEDYVIYSINTAIDIVREYPKGDILVFLTGQTEIERACLSLQEIFTESHIAVLKLHSTMPPEEQDLVFQKTNKRKIILSTNIAETSVTIENVKFVVDSGKVKLLRRSESSLVDYLEIVGISKSQAIQRAGRSGRTGPGIVYRIYTEENYYNMQQNTLPEILRSNLSSVILSLKSLGVNNVENFEFIDAPLLDKMKSCIQSLYYLKAIDLYGNITDFGRFLSILPVCPELGASLFAASKIGCIDQVSTISAFLEFQNVFLDIKPESPDYKNFKLVKNKFTNKKGIFYTYLQIYDEWKKADFKPAFLGSNFLNVSSMFQIKNIKEQLLNFFSNRIENNSNFESAFCFGFFMRIAKRYENGYKTIFDHVECHLHPNDPLFKEFPKYVIFYDLLCIKKNYMYQCLEIDEKTLLQAVNQKHDFIF